MNWRSMAWLLAFSLAGCAVPGKPIQGQRAQYDLGAAATASQPIAGSALPLEVRTGLGLEGTGIRYRLAYAGGEQVREYAWARWSAPVAELLAQRLSQRLGLPRIQSGFRGPCVVFVEVDDFVQVFPTPEMSNGQVSARISLRQGTGRVAQGALQAASPSPSATVQGGVSALAKASDQLADAIGQWLQSLSAETTAACRQSQG